MKNAIFLKTWVIALSIAFFGITSCTEEAKFDLNGKVINSTQNGVKNATVELLSGTQVVETATTDVNGNYILKAKEGSYQLRVTATGYNATVESIDLTGNQEKNVTLLGSATVMGRVLDSQSGQGIGNAAVKLNRSVGDKTSDAGYEIIVYTNLLGYYTINYCPVGTLVGIIEIENFLPREVLFNVTEGSNNIGDQTVVSPPQEGQLRIVLTWGATPSDLDSHLTGPNSLGGRFHVYYSNKVDGGAELDLDDVSSYGPETITIKQLRDGMYRYSVHNFSNQYSNGGQGIYDSPAKVEVYNSTGLIYSYLAPVFPANGGNT